jgi:RHS repeat-associated protein
VNEYTFEAYGDLIAGVEGVENNYRYTGEQYIPELDNYYLRARNYDAGVGRFTSVDPFGGVMTQPLTLNKYGYTEERPTTYTDPSGEMTKVGLIVTLSVIGMLTAYDMGWLRNFGSDLDKDGLGIAREAQKNAAKSVKDVLNHLDTEPELAEKNSELFFGKNSIFDITKIYRKMHQRLKGHIRFALSSSLYVKAFEDNPLAYVPSLNRWSSIILKKSFFNNKLPMGPEVGKFSKTLVIIHETAHLISQTSIVDYSYKNLFQTAKDGFGIFNAHSYAVYCLEYGQTFTDDDKDQWWNKVEYK